MNDPRESMPGTFREEWDDMMGGDFTPTDARYCAHCDHKIDPDDFGCTRESCETLPLDEYLVPLN